MDIVKLANQAKRLISDNSPVILTAIGVTGTVTTAILAAKGAFKAHDILQDSLDKGVMPEPNDTIKLTWKCYLPAVATGTMTVGCIIGANYIGTKRAAAIAAAYSLSEKAIGEYKEKVIDRIGPDNEADLRRQIAQDKAKAASSEVVFVGDGDVLCHDAYSGRFFNCNKERLRKASNDINFEILHGSHATISDFYKKVGLEPTSVSDEMGWNSEYPCELLFATVETKEGKPCLSYDFAVVPIRDPWHFR